MGQGVVVASLAEVCITRELNVFGGMCSLDVSLFYRIFYSLEDAGLLDPSNEADLFSLHFVFISRINRQLVSSKLQPPLTTY